MRFATAMCAVMLVAAPALGFAQDKPYPDFDSIAKTAGPTSENRVAPAVQTNIPGTIRGGSASMEKGGTRPQGGDMPYPDWGAVKKTGPALESVPATIVAPPMQEGLRPHDIPKQEHLRCEGDRERDRGEGARKQACNEPRPGCDRDCDRRAQDREKSCDRSETGGERRCDEPARDVGSEQGCDAAKGGDDEDDENGEPGPTQKSGLTISRFVLYAERSLSMGDCGKVRHGDLGVRSFAETSHGSQLKIGRDSFVQPSHIVLSPSVAVARNVTLGVVGTDQLLDDGILIGATAAFSAAAMPPLPLAPAAASGGQNISVGSDQVLALPPGNYGTLTVNGILLLNPGRYVVSKVQVGDFGRIVAVAGDVQMTVVDTLTAGRHTAIYPDFRLPAQQFSISVAGSDAKDRPAASIGEHSLIRALLAAPHGTLALADHVRATGAFAAFDIAVGAHAMIEFQNGFPADPPGGHGSQQLHGYFTPPIFNAPIAGPVPASTVISLAIGLPVQNLDALKKAVQQTSDPSSPQYRKYLSPDQFAATFGPTQPDYQSLIDWAQAKGLSVVSTYPNRLLLDVSGTAEQLEQALFTSLDLRLRPDGTQFYALDRDPSIDLTVPVLWISGLDTRVVAVPGGRPIPNSSGGGSGPSGFFNSRDIRAAYAACAPALTGAGQSVGLFELDGFTANDISAYECVSGGATCVSNTPTSAVPAINTVLLDKATGTPATVNGSFEAALDIEMAIAMAPGLAQINVFEVPNIGNVGFHNDILNSMATTLPLSKQLSSSWFFNIDPNTQPILYALAMGGQSFFQAAGDQGSSSWGTDPGDIRDEDAVTIVGGTTLTLTGKPPAYQSETTWNIAGEGAGGGGVAANVNLPLYQTGIDMTSNKGSPTNRNLPDVAAVATNLSVAFTDPSTGTQSTQEGAGGTSAAAPLWAAFVALVNQQAPISFGTVGNANQFLYTLGKNPAACSPFFNDVTTGNNNGTCPGQGGPASSACSVNNKDTWTPGTGLFSAVTGYDLATGWGTPKCTLINELAFGLINIVSVTITIRTGHDNARPDSELQASLPCEPALCLKPSNNADSDPVCSNGGSATDRQGQQEWKEFTNSVQTFVLATPQPVTVLNTLTIQLISHNHFPETDDNWDIQGITVVATDTNGKTWPLLDVSNPDGDKNSNNCIVRLTGKIGSFTFNLNPGNPTGSNPGIPPGSCPQSQ